MSRTITIASVLASWTVVVLGATSLVVTGQLHVAAAGVALASSLLVLSDPDRLRVPNWAWNLLGVAALAVSLAAWKLWYVHPVSVIAHLTVFFQVYRLLARRGNGAGLPACYLIAFSQLTLASILTVHFSFLAMCVAFAVSVTWALLLQQVAASYRAACVRASLDGDGPPPPPDGLLRPAYLGFVTAMTVALLVGAVVIFLAMPRLQIGLANRYSSAVHVSGFAEEVRLGDVGRILLRNEPVMRVKVQDPQGNPLDLPLYYHGLALDRFDGKLWKLSNAAPLQLVNGAVSPTEGRPPPPEANITQRYSLEPINSRVIFFVPTPIELLVPLHRIEAAATEGYFLPAGAERPDYVVHSAAVRPSPAEFRAAVGDVPPEIVATYLQMPPVSQRVRDLAQRWVSMGRTPYDGVLVVEQQLREGFTYSLDQPSAGAEDPVDHFLFESMEGHCEFYATAMAVMLRSAGLPTRLVNGFHGGEYNQAGDYFIVRQHHAHSWVEVFFPGLGWQVFDPTPVVSAGSGDVQLTYTSLIQGWLDIAGVRWRRTVLYYDQGDQFGALDRGLQSLAGHHVLGVPDLVLPALPTGTRRGAAGGVFWVALAAVFGLTAVALMLGFRALQASRAAMPDVPRGRPRRYVRITRQWLALAADRSATAAGATPMEVAWAWDRAGADRHGSGLIQRYYAVRFGGGTPGRADVAAARAQLRTVRRSPSWRAAGRK